jgi:hypothetical protein
MIVSLIVLAAAVAAPSPAAQIVSRKPSIEIPFELVDNRIFLTARINGRGPFKLLLDTGAGAVLSDALIGPLGLGLVDAGETSGVGEKRVAVGRTEVDEVAIGDLRLTHQPFSSMSLADAPHVFGTARFDGIIGLPLFERFVVTVDYDRSRIEVAEPAQQRPPRGAVLVPFQRTHFLPEVQGELDGVRGTFGIDLGARSALLLYGPFVEANRLRERYAPRFEAITGWGIGGPVRSNVVRVGTLRLGGVCLSDLVARFSVQRAGLLTGSGLAALVGPDVLRQFVVTFDYSRQRLYFREGPHYGARDTYDRSGMWMGQEGGDFVILDVVPGGPAAAAGLAVGDRVASVDDAATEGLLLPAVRERMRTLSPGRRVRLGVRAGAGTREVVVELRDLV